MRATNSSRSPTLPWSNSHCRQLQEHILLMRSRYVRNHSYPLVSVNSSTPSLAVTYIPAWFPGAGWKRTALDWRKDLNKMCDSPYEFTKTQLVRISFNYYLFCISNLHPCFIQRTGTADPSLVSLQMENYADREAIIKDAASSMYAGKYYAESLDDPFYID